jgi:uncharacterized protein YbjQ (UPF0145 family)
MPKSAIVAKSNLFIEYNLNTNIRICKKRKYNAGYFVIGIINNYICSINKKLQEAIMIVTTTNNIEGRSVTQYMGIVTGETIIGANLFRDIFASVRDVVGGRSGSYEEVLREAKDTALREMTEKAQRMGADAVIGIDLDYETIRNGMLMVTASGTAVKLS